MSGIANYIYWQGRWWRGKNLVRAEALFLNHTLDLVSGERRDVSIHDSWKAWLGIKFDHDFKRPFFAHLAYELGHLVMKSGVVDPNQVLALFSEYEELEPIELGKRTPLKFKPLKAPSEGDYLAAFKRGYEHLLSGDCYQFNLTYPFEWESEGEVSALDFISSLRSASDYAHAIYVPALGFSLLSNSPESLFAKEENHLVTRPIKGTIKITEGVEKLLSSKKDLAELDMITDLLRNDLNRIDKPLARVRQRRQIMEVPELFHQYSEVAVALGPHITLLEIVKALFPSGSVTGAPKKRVMEILNEIESGPRSFYCGSTLFGYHQTLRASVNIRTGLYDHHHKRLRYHAGGGCTLLSQGELEYQEMLAKVASFFRNIS